MAQGRLETIFSLSEMDDGQQLTDLLPLPTLEERVNLYLNLVHGPREFTSKERLDARKAILDAMTGSIQAQSGDRDMPVSPATDTPLSRTDTPLSRTDTPEIEIDHLMANIEAVSARARVEPRLASAAFEAPEEGVSWSVRRTPASSEVFPSVPRQTRRFSKRTVITFAAIATAVAFAMPPLLSTDWFGGQTKSSRSIDVAARLGSENREPLNLNKPTNSQTTNVSADFSQPKPPVPLSSIASVLPRDTSLAVKQLELVDKLFVSGNVSGARSVLTDAANRGDAASAFALAATFDPIEIERLGRRDVTPDIFAARAWYEKAYKLGAAEAQARLQRLSDRIPSPGPK